MRSNSSSSFEKGFVGHTNVKPTCKQASLLKREDVWDSLSFKKLNGVGFQKSTLVISKLSPA